MKPEKISDAMNHIDEAIIEETETVRRTKKNRKKSWIKWGVPAACLAVVLIVGVSVLNQPNNQIAISSNSSNVTVRYIKNPPTISGNGDIALLTEEEIFTMYDTAIFKGSISEIRNIELDFNGVKDYRAIAKIKVEKVYRGSCKANDIISVLLPCPIADGIWVEDTDVVSAMRVGMTGIFMPMAYDNENSIWEQNGARLIKKDIADYGFLDGLQYAFLETDDGLLFSKNSYESIDSATTLNEVEQYIETMLENLPNPGGVAETSTANEEAPTTGETQPVQTFSE